MQSLWKVARTSSLSARPHPRREPFTIASFRAFVDDQWSILAFTKGFYLSLAMNLI